VAGVKNVEAAVGEYNALTLGAHVFNVLQALSCGGVVAAGF
jgi:hypothetical protein